MQASAAPTACVIVIGNEILSGRTQDKNIAFIAQTLGKQGIPLAEVRIIPDVAKTIIDTVNHFRKTYTYVFTTGGIGPTHDDITAQSVADAFGVPLLRHKEAQALLERHYKEGELNDARLKMADIPLGGTLIPNPVSAAPGFQLENVYVMAGVPSIMQAMLSHVAPTLNGGPPISSRTYSVFIPEGTLAKDLGDVQNRHPDIEIGSYPFFRHQKLGTSLVMRGSDNAKLEACAKEVHAMLLKFDEEIIEGEV